MKKITIEKGETVGEIIERIITDEEDELVLVVPRNSKFADSIVNFNLLRREAEKAKKRVVIESVDEEVLAYAEASEIENIHPLFSGGRGKSLTDIVPEESSEVKLREKSKKDQKKKKKITLKVVPVEEDEDEEEDSDEGVLETETEAELELEVLEQANHPTPSYFNKREDIPSALKEHREEVIMEDIEEDEPKPRRWVKWFVWFFILLILAGAGAWATGTFFSRADVSVNFRKTAWQFENIVTATRNTSEIDTLRRVIPAEVFRDQRNLTQLFKASGKAVVSEKASGKIQIFNAYSSQPQALVATTRFESPDGKIYRLDSAITVPGAEIKDGKIIPASIDATVVADKAGPEYNASAIEKLTIPGFKGTPKFAGFYGKMEAGTAGGFTGEKAVPTDADIATAKEKTTEILKSSLQTNLLSRRPTDFKVIDGTSQLEVTKLNVNPSTDSNGNFSIFGEAKFQAIGFRESDVKTMLTQSIQEEYPNYDFKELNLSYEAAQPSFDKGEVRFALKAQGYLAPAFAPEQFKNTLANSELTSAQAMIGKLPDLNDAHISVWPFWVKYLPKDSGKINLQVSYP